MGKIRTLTGSEEKEEEAEEKEEKRSALPPPPKRAKIRSVKPKPVAKPAPAPTPSPFFALLDREPAVQANNPFNVSEIILDFLYIGAGYDELGRMVTSLPGNHEELAPARLEWWTSHHVTSALNMAGSPLQTELRGLSYPPGDAVRALALDVNDVEEWQGEDMRRAFQAGAQFIQDEFLAGGRRVFVHCVAGVNRSPFVVVWWLVKFHHVHPQYAYDLVRVRRDLGVNWDNQTLGGLLLHPALPARSRKRWWDQLLI